MAISISNAVASPNQLPDGTVTSVTISFQGVALSSSTNVIVSFEISPFPELNFNNADTVSAPFVFDTSSQTFTKTVSVTNSSSTSSTWQNGMIGLTATEYHTGYSDVAYAAIVYK
jgi:hypothetical protein